MSKVIVCPEHAGIVQMFETVRAEVRANVAPILEEIRDWRREREAANHRAEAAASEVKHSLEVTVDGINQRMASGAQEHIQRCEAIEKSVQEYAAEFRREIKAVRSLFTRILVGIIIGVGVPVVGYLGDLAFRHIFLGGTP